MPYIMIKPKILKAKQFLPENRPWPRGVETNISGCYILSKSTHPWNPRIHPGDWVIYEEKKRHVCMKSQFKEKYDVVEDIEPR